MARIKKKGESGQAKNYITRTQAVRKLQISLPDFRRLCIFKGIYPREPRNIKKANKSASHSTTFYYTKDIQYLLHEPLLAKFREQKTLSKKIAGSLGRNEVHEAMRLEKHGMPPIKLDHIVRERYPTFVDAVRDLDDALSLLFLFANLPSNPTVPAKTISKCQRLCHEFEHYLITTHSLRRSFLSIKGIYYQATIQGQDVMWLVPYKFVQKVTQDVDYRIMATFVEFYCTLLGFVNYRLYTSIGLVYPPKFDTTSDAQGAELAAFTLQGRGVAENIGDGEARPLITNGDDTENSAEIQAQIDQIAQSIPTQIETRPEDDQDAEVETDKATIDTFKIVAPEADDLPRPDNSGEYAAMLFANLTVFISREAPRHPIEFILRAFGCKRVAWDAVLGDGAYTHNETDSRITHQIVDRPATVETPSGPDLTGPAASNPQQVVRSGHIVPGRIYVQPQWVWDCINEGKLLRPDTYAPGATLPPHLSPWIKPTNGQYDPRATLEEQEPEGEGEEQMSDVDEVEDEPEDEIEDAIDEIQEGSLADLGAMDVAGSESDSSQDDEDEQDGVFGGFDEVPASDGDSELDEEVQHQREIEAEAQGRSTGNNGRVDKTLRSPAAKARQAEQRKRDEQVERQKMMMSNKKRKLYEKMVHSNNQKDAEAEKLRGKRRKLERKQRA